MLGLGIRPFRFSGLGAESGPATCPWLVSATQGRDIVDAADVREAFELAGIPFDEIEGEIRETPEGEFKVLWRGREVTASRIL